MDDGEHEFSIKKTRACSNLMKILASNLCMLGIASSSKLFSYLTTFRREANDSSVKMCDGINNFYSHSRDSLYT